MVIVVRDRRERIDPHSYHMRRDEKFPDGREENHELCRIYPKERPLVLRRGAPLRSYVV